VCKDNVFLFYKQIFPNLSKSEIQKHTKDELIISDLNSILSVIKNKICNFASIFNTLSNNKKNILVI